MRRLTFVLLCALLASLGLVAGAGAQTGPVTVTLDAQNSSGQSGTATLTAMGDQTQVVVKISGEPAGASEPMHIHTGSCSNLGGVKYPLTNVADGASTTMVAAKLSDLTTGGFAINGHKSAQEISVYVFCGNIAAAAGASAQATTSASGTATSASGTATSAASAATSATATASSTSSAATPAAAPNTGSGGMAISTAAYTLAIVLLAAVVLAIWAGRRREA